METQTQSLGFGGVYASSTFLSEEVVVLLQSARYRCDDAFWLLCSSDLAFYFIFYFIVFYVKLC